jgi:acyl carrier protein
MAVSRERTYSVFISYSRKTDATLAPALEQALERFAKPWNRMRALNVFRDDSELSVNPGLWASIAAALADSEFFVLLASPAAASSTWVGREVEHWLAHRDINRLLIVVTDGDVLWESSAGDFNWTRTSALPDALRGVFGEEPRYVDLRWARGRERLTLDDDRFRDAVADIAATLHGRPKADMVGEQVRQHRRTIRLARGAIVVLSFLTLAALAAASFAVWQSRVAANERDAARGRELAARSSAELDVDPVAAVRLAAAGVRSQQLPETEHALRAAFSDTRLGASSVLRGHEETLFGAEFDAAGTRIVTASDDGTARIWDATTGASVAILRGRPGETSTAVFDAEGKRVVTAGSPGVVVVWDAATGRTIATLHNRGNVVYRASFDPRGRRVITADDIGARVWNAATGALLMTLRHPAGCFDASFAADGSRIVTAGNDGIAQIWDAATGKRLVDLPQSGRYLRSAAFDPTGRRILTVADNGAARVWNPAGAKPPRDLGTVQDAAFDESGTRVVTAGADGAARVWNAAAGRSVATLAGGGSGLTRVAFDPTGRRVVAGREDGTALVWDVSTGETVAVLYGHENTVVSVDFDPAGRRIVTASSDGTARVWDTSERIAPVLRAGTVSGIAFDSDGRFVSGNVGRPVRIWDVESWRPVARPHDRTERFVRALDGTTQLRDATAQPPGVAPAGALAFNRDGSLVAVQGDNSTVLVRHSSDGKTVAVLRGHSRATSSPYAVGITHAAFDPTGDHIVTVGLDGTARIWVSTTGRQVAVLRGHGNIVRSAVFDPTGTRVVTTGQEGNGRIWDAATGATDATLPGASAPTVFDARGDLLVTLGQHGTALVWDAATGERLAVLRDDEPVATAAISPDGRFIVTLGRAGTARIHTCRACGTIEDLLDEAADYPGLRPLPASLDRLVAWRAKVLARVRNVVADVLGRAPRDVTEDASLPNDLGLEYLTEIELVIELEDTFGIKISDAAMKRIEAGTVAGVANYIAARA